MADQFEERVTRAVFGVEPDALLVRYDLVQLDEKRTHIRHSIVVDNSRDKPPPTPIGIDEYFEGKTHAKEIFDALRERILTFEPTFKPVPHSLDGWVTLWQGAAGTKGLKKPPSLRVWASQIRTFKNTNLKTKIYFQGTKDEFFAVDLTSPNDVDQEIVDWLHSVYSEYRNRS